MSRPTPPRWGPFTHHRIEVDRRPPAVDRVTPANGAEACPDLWSCRLVDDGHGVAPLSIALKMGGKVFGIEHPAVSFEPLTGQLTLDLTRTGLAFADGGKATVQITAADEAGQAMAAPTEASFVYRAALDRSPPRAPSLLLVDPDGSRRSNCRARGPSRMGWINGGRFGSETVVERTRETSAAGRMRSSCAAPRTARVQRLRAADAFQRGAVPIP